MSPLETSPKRYCSVQVFIDVVENMFVLSLCILVHFPLPALRYCGFRTDVPVGDHKNSAAFWAALKVQPIIQSGVQTWKALILVSILVVVLEY